MNVDVRLAAASPGLTLQRAEIEGESAVLTPQAQAFLVDLERTFGPRRWELLARRAEVQARIDGGWLPDFLPETADVRAGDWTVAPIPAPLRDRRVEITGPVDRKMIINGLNSGANVFMADFEDSNAPTWANLIVGQQNLRDAVAGTISLDDPARGRQYRLKPNPAVLIVRPRGWHLDEAHVRVDGAPMSASLFDFGLYFFHNATTQAAQGNGPYFYLPKIENHLEARLWRDVIAHAERACGIVAGTTRVTVLIETILAVFEMDEILFELRDVIAGLNCGRWDYIFSTIKKLRNRADFVFPDRALVTMESPALRAYSRLLIRTCHRRGALAMGGMAAQIPIRADVAANDAALAKVRTDKEREARDGHDGTWVAHPDLVPVARAVFDREMPTPNQVGRELPAMTIGQRDLLGVPAGAITEQGLRHNIRVGVQYLEAWLRGVGCVPLYNLMEDAATAEISRAQVWQWLKHGARLDDGRAVTADLVEHAFAEEIAALAASRPEATRLDDAAAVFRDVALADQFEDFLTVPAYRRLLALE